MFGILQETLLKAFHDHLIGVHLRDILNGYSDHNSLGCSAVNFDMIKFYLKPETIRIMEINQRVSPADAKRGIAFFNDKGSFSCNNHFKCQTNLLPREKAT